VGAGGKNVHKPQGYVLMSAFNYTNMRGLALSLKKQRFPLLIKDDEPTSRIAQDYHQNPTLLGGDCLRFRFPEGLDILLQHYTQSDKRVNQAGCEADCSSSEFKLQPWPCT